MGQPVVYGEVIIIINLLMNYLILWLTSKFTHVKVTKKRLISGAAVGALYSLAMFLPALGYLYSMLGKIIFSLLILLITFAPLTPKNFLACFGYFYLVSFSLIGIAVGASYFVNNNSTLTHSYHTAINLLNNYLYYILLLTAAIGLIVGKLGPVLIKRKAINNLFKVVLTLVFNNLQVQVEALIDTGNNLRDPISQMPVIVVEYSALEDILPQGIKQAFVGGGDPKLDQVVDFLDDALWASRLRLIPYNSLGKKNGMLIAFKADKVIVYTGNETIETGNIIIGIHNRQLCPNQSYRALLHPDILQTVFG